MPLRRNLLTALYDALIATGGEVAFNSRAIAAEPDGRLHFADGGTRKADLIIAADGVNSPLRDSLGLLKWRRPARQFGYRAMIRREPAELGTAIGVTHCEHWNGSRRLLYAPCTAAEAYIQLTSLAGDDAGNAVPIDRDYWCRLFPHLAWIIERLPDDGRGDWFEMVRLHDWSSGRVAVVGDAASGQPPFLGQGGGCAIMSAFALAHTLDCIGDVLEGLAVWEWRHRPFVEWVQRVSWWYGRSAFLPAPARTALFKAVGRNAWLASRTLFVAARRDVTAEPRELPIPAQTLPIYPLMH